MANKYQQAISILRKAKADISETLKGEHHELRITTNLERDIQYLSLTTGTAVEEQAREAVKLGIATTIAGEPIQVAKAGTTAEELQPDESDVEKLKAAANSLYGQFLNIDNKKLLKDYQDIVLRAVARKAGLKVTKDEPAKLDSPFITSVKEAIKKQQADLQAKIEEATARVVAAREKLAADPTPEKDNAWLEELQEALSILDQLKAQA